MTFLGYQEFLEEIVRQLKDKVKGQIELRRYDYEELTCRYDIEVKFAYNLSIIVNCDWNSEISKLYYSYKHEPEKAVYVGTMQGFDFIKRSIFDCFFQIP